MSFQAPSSDYDSALSIDENGMDNEAYIKEKLEGADLGKGQKQETLVRILRLIYFNNFPENGNENGNRVAHGTIRNYEHALTAGEYLMARKLSTKWTTKQKIKYGTPAIHAMKRARYECQIEGCGVRDIRCLEIDHVDGRDKETIGLTENPYSAEDFQILCGNHHNIKSANERMVKEE